MLVWAGREKGRKYNSQKSIIYELERRLRGRPRKRWQDEVREDGRLAGGMGRRKEYITERSERSSLERQ
jgi:hypothetical protein